MGSLKLGESVGSVGSSQKDGLRTMFHRRQVQGSHSLMQLELHLADRSTQINRLLAETQDAPKTKHI